MIKNFLEFLEYPLYNWDKKLLRKRVTDFISEIVLHKKFEDCLEGIEGFSHMIICFGLI